MTHGQFDGKTYDYILKEQRSYAAFLVENHEDNPKYWDFVRFVRKTVGGIMRHGQYRDSTYCELVSEDSGYASFLSRDHRDNPKYADFVKWYRRGKKQNIPKKSRFKAERTKKKERFSESDSESSAATLKGEVEKARAQVKRAKEEARQAKEEANAQATKAMKAVEEARHAKVEAKKAKGEINKSIKRPAASLQAEGDECKVCMDDTVQTVFVPCGHMVACLSCSSRIKEGSGKCPICCKSIKKVVRTYKS